MERGVRKFGNSIQMYIAKSERTCMQAKLAKELLPYFIDANIHKLTLCQSLPINGHKFVQYMNTSAHEFPWHYRQNVNSS